jgi:hypothetical protein
MNSFIMVWDPTGEIPDGTLLAAQAASQKAAQGCVLLATDTSVHSDQAFGAFAKRSWGPGFPSEDLPGMRYFAPLAMYGEPIHTKLSWAARLRQVQPSDVSGAPIGMGGQCALNPFTAQRGSGHLAFAANEMPQQMSHLGPPDAWGGWTLKGSANVTISGGGFYAFALAGAVTGVRVMWVASTFSKE